MKGEEMKKVINQVITEHYALYNGDIIHSLYRMSNRFLCVLYCLEICGACNQCDKGKYDRWFFILCGERYLYMVTSPTWNGWDQVH